MVIGGFTITAYVINGVTYFCRIAAVNRELVALLCVSVYPGSRHVKRLMSLRHYDEETHVITGYDTTDRAIVHLAITQRSSSLC